MATLTSTQQTPIRGRCISCSRLPLWPIPSSSPLTGTWPSCTHSSTRVRFWRRVRQLHQSIKLINFSMTQVEQIARVLAHEAPSALCHRQYCMAGLHLVESFNANSGYSIVRWNTNWLALLHYCLWLLWTPPDADPLDEYRCGRHDLQSHAKQNRTTVEICQRAGMPDSGNDRISDNWRASLVWKKEQVTLLILGVSRVSKHQT